MTRSLRKSIIERCFQNDNEETILELIYTTYIPFTVDEITTFMNKNRNLKVESKTRIFDALYDYCPDLF